MVLTSKEIREIEQAAVANGLSWEQLMNNAGNAAAKQLALQFSIVKQKIVILCGKGNNGGDGYVIARQLSKKGTFVTVVLTAGLPTTSQATEMFNKLPTSINLLHWDKDNENIYRCLAEADFIVDAVYGIGFHGALPDNLRPLFRSINENITPVVAIDIPSGMNADLGLWDKDTLQAAFTLTFIALKPALENRMGKDIYGTVKVASINIPDSILSPYRSAGDTVLIPENIQRCFPPRLVDTNKGSFGRALLVCGSSGMVGAAILAASASLRCGAGLTELALPASLYPIAASHMCEPIFTLLEETDNHQVSACAVPILRERISAASAMGIGSGLGTSLGAQALVLDCLAHANCPIVLDADGLNIIAKQLPLLKNVQAPLIMTPHPGEMSRLTGKTVAEIQANRVTIACEFAEQYNVILVLKGHGTIIAVPEKPPVINPTGNPGMATGGSGDLLTGMIVSLLAQGLTAENAAICGVYLHGLAGDKAAARLSQRAMLPTDMLDELPSIFLQLEKQNLE